MREAMQTLPPCTLSVVCLCVALFALSLFIGQSSVIICPVKVLYGLQVWRLMSHAFFHGSFTHLAMNMLAFAGLGSSVKQRT